MGFVQAHRVFNSSVWVCFYSGWCSLVKWVPALQQVTNNSVLSQLFVVFSAVCLFLLSYWSVQPPQCVCVFEAAHPNLHGNPEDSKYLKTKLSYLNEKEKVQHLFDVLFLTLRVFFTICPTARSVHFVGFYSVVMILSSSGYNPMLIHAAALNTDTLVMFWFNGLVGWLMGSVCALKLGQRVFLDEEKLVKKISGPVCVPSKPFSVSYYRRIDKKNYKWMEKRGFILLWFLLVLCVLWGDGSLCERVCLLVFCHWGGPAQTHWFILNSDPVIFPFRRRPS